MADIVRLYAGPGPLPLKVPFQTEVTGPAAIYFHASAYSPVSNAILRVNVSFDGQALATSFVYTNEMNSHKALVPRVTPVRLTRGAHEISITAGENTIADGNDYFVVDLML